MPASTTRWSSPRQGCAGLGSPSRITFTLPARACVPAPGQGIVAVEIREDDDTTRRAVSRHRRSRRVGGAARRACAGRSARRRMPDAGWRARLERRRRRARTGCRGRLPRWRRGPCRRTGGAAGPRPRISGGGSRASSLARGAGGYPRRGAARARRRAGAAAVNREHRVSRRRRTGPSRPDHRRAVSNASRRPTWCSTTISFTRGCSDHARADAEKIDVGIAAPQPTEQEAICYLLAEKAREGKSGRPAEMGRSVHLRLRRHRSALSPRAGRAVRGRSGHSGGHRRGELRRRSAHLSRAAAIR